MKPKRNKAKWNEFRRAFKKWSDARRRLAIDSKYIASQKSLVLVDGDGYKHEYIAPDYVKYMAYMWRIK